MTGRVDKQAEFSPSQDEAVTAAADRIGQARPGRRLRDQAGRTGLLRTPEPLNPCARHADREPGVRAWSLRTRSAETGVVEGFPYARLKDADE